MYDCNKAPIVPPTGSTLPEMTMAFQPIVDLSRGEIFAYEALVRRPPHGGNFDDHAGEILGRVPPDLLGEFDERCRDLAISSATRLGLQGFLALNFIPEVLADPGASLRRSLECAAARRLLAHRLIFEVSAATRIDSRKLRAVLAEYRAEGVITAIDDFGAAHGGLHLLADCQPDLVKIDMQLIRGIHRDRARRAIVRAIATLCADLGISLVAEGVEEVDEAYELRELDVRLFQGYLFGRPAIDMLPQPNLAILDQLTGQHAALRLLESAQA
jgi:EAL domain-containing protein (putative c-di-GMP-specific phosphodiesterase class I)